jgi:plastocyanin
VPAGGGTVVELIGQVPQTIVLVDHALARAFDKGAIGQVIVEGDPNPEIFEALGLQVGPISTAAPASPAPSAAPVPSGAGGDEDVAILAGSGEFQAADDPNEFAASESPADFSVNVLTVKVGTTVTWTNEDSMVHTVTDAGGTFDSGLLQGGDRWSYTFATAGEFEYFCGPHPWMRAKVIVEG